VQLSVRDTGIGIATDFLPHVFERFRQGEGPAPRSHGGLGLGLSIVKHLAEAHGGEVSAASDGPGTGATFTVTLPLGAAISAEAT
jgi:signal transduction histidine kinase